MVAKLIKYSFVILLASVLLALLFKDVRDEKVGADLAVSDLKESEKLKADKSKVLADIDVGSTTKYAYASDVKVASTSYNGKNEDLSKRTYNTQVYPLDKKDKNGNDQYELKVYAGAAFYKDGTDWVNVEYGTTTKEAFELQMKSTIIDEVSYLIRRTFLPYQKALAQTSYYPHGSDGRIYSNSSNWATARGATSGVYDSTGQSVVTFIQAEDIGGPDYYISHSFFNFDTSAIDDSYTVSAATFYLYPTGVGVTNETTYPANPRIVANTSASDTSIANADYDAVGTTLLSDSTQTLSAFISAGAYVGFALNSTGISAVSKTGYTKLAIRGSNDFSDSTVPTARSYANGYATEQTGTSNDPYLSVTASAGGGSTPVKIPDIIFFD